MVKHYVALIIVLRQTIKKIKLLRHTKNCGTHRKICISNRALSTKTPKVADFATKVRLSESINAKQCC